jgi:hypothetical protein
VDVNGKRDSTEYINVAKDDAFAWPQQARRAYPSPVNRRMHSTIAPFVRKSLEVNNLLLGVFETKLGLLVGVLIQKHRAEEYSGCEARVTKTLPSPPDHKGPVLGGHTDFGTLVRCTSSTVLYLIYLFMHESHFCIIGWEVCRFLFLALSHGNISRCHAPSCSFKFLRTGQLPIIAHAWTCNLQYRRRSGHLQWRHPPVQRTPGRVRV